MRAQAVGGPRSGCPSHIFTHFWALFSSKSIPLPSTTAELGSLGGTRPTFALALNSDSAC